MFEKINKVNKKIKSNKRFLLDGDYYFSDLEVIGNNSKREVEEIGGERGNTETGKRRQGNSGLMMGSKPSFSKRNKMRREHK